MINRIALLFSILFLCSYGDVFCQSERFVRTVVIDAGHGGRDPGTLGKKSKEKDIALAIALKTGAYIERNFPDLHLIYTRKTDRFVELHQRAKIANNANADLFISIHANAFPSSKIYGTETYVMGLHVSDENLAVAQKENAVILQEEDYQLQYEGFDPNSPEAYIIFSLYQNIYLDQSLDFAAKVESQFKNRVGLKSRGVRQAGFFVLYQVKMPSILIETGYLSNPKDEKYLMSKRGQTYIASAIYRAFKDYKKDYEKNTVIQTMPDKVLVSAKSELKDIVFRVQVESSTKDIRKHRKFKGYKNFFVYKQKGVFKYCIGLERKLNRANQLKKELRKKKFKGAFVVAFLNKKRISLKKAREMLKK